MLDERKCHSGCATHANRGGARVVVGVRVAATRTRCAWSLNTDVWAESEAEVERAGEGDGRANSRSLWSDARARVSFHCKL